MTQRASALRRPSHRSARSHWHRRASAIEPTAQAIEYYNASLDHYFVTAFPEEAAMLDAGTVVKGWARTGVTFNVWRDAADDPAAVPVCRFFGTPNVGPNSHFYTASAAECALVKTNPDWTYEAIAFHVAVPQGGACQAGTEAVYRSFHPGASVSQSNHRFLPDLTMHQKMASSSMLEGVVMCAPLSTAQRQADAVRLLEQSTFGPTRRARLARDGRRHRRLRRRAARGLRLAVLEQQVRAVRPGGDLLSARSQSQLLPRLLLAVPAPERLLPQCDRQRRPASAARGVRAVADIRHVGPRHQRGVRHGGLPADLPRPRVRQL